MVGEVVRGVWFGGCGVSWHAATTNEGVFEGVAGREVLAGDTGREGLNGVNESAFEEATGRTLKGVTRQDESTPHMDNHTLRRPFSLHRRPDNAVLDPIH